MRALLDVILIVLQLYTWVLIIAAVLSWLLAFNVVNAYNPVVRTIGEFIFRITEPVLAPLRSILPSLGGLDLSPMVLILIIFFIERVIGLYIYPYVF
ncbi:MAG: YggT family protein [Rhizobiales bacterium 24-66-13]|jgi:YggT family protein|uniref:YggT family protein n=1 Tax=Roseixanthobacter finlandensis TaxID=3119922 RepID=UPI000BCF7FFC|nr:MAG: YggT family protein [Rhizobiales bacterium 12-66-7]OYZ72521.1 MAG: YggT family protein [Rhizobiales bacterium 24-66-13]OZB03004.1 MAG: YggT family protein [Rhizobiales bacterium 39-66-18]HQS08088.1 YggT family protein [Xanthobacteraceae bacterium]HQS46136.1 YggT family protein [Xanthobacteraceae bacterium]